MNCMTPLPGSGRIRPPPRPSPRIRSDPAAASPLSPDPAGSARRPPLLPKFGGGLRPSAPDPAPQPQTAFKQSCGGELCCCGPRRSKEWGELARAAVDVEARVWWRWWRWWLAGVVVVAGGWWWRRRAWWRGGKARQPVGGTGARHGGSIDGRRSGAGVVAAGMVAAANAAAWWRP